MATLGHLAKASFEAQEIEVRLILLKCCATTAHHFRCQALKLREHGTGFEQKHAAVPGEPSAGQELFSGGQVWLFHKASDRHRLQRSGVQRFGGFDVAVTGFRRCRHDAEGHQSPRLGCNATRLNRRLKVLCIANDVVCSQYKQQWIFTAGRGLQGRHCDSWCRVAPHGFEENGPWFDPDLAHLFGHDEAVIVVADQQRSVEPLNAFQALLGLLQQSFFATAAKGPVLLGITGSGERPEACSCATAEDHRS